MLTRFRRFAPYVVPLFFGGCLFVVATTVHSVRPELRVLVLTVLSGVTVSIIGAAAFLAARVARMSSRRAMHVALTPIIFTAGTLSVFMLVEHNVTRYVIAVIALGLLCAHFASVLAMRGEIARYGHEELGHLSFVLQVIASFFGFAFAFGVSAFTTLPQAVVAVATGISVMLFTRERLWSEGFSSEQTSAIAIAIGILGTEFFFALSFLPTTWAVNAAVALILLVSGLHATVRILKGTALLRRQFAFTFILILLVLGTARWT